MRHLQSGLGAQMPSWRSIVPKRTRGELDRRKLQSLRLRETGEGSCLTVDADAQRIEIGQSATEIEREWLYQALVKHSSLPLSQEAAR